MLLHRDMVGCGEIEHVRMGQKKHRNFTSEKFKYNHQINQIDQITHCAIHLVHQVHPVIRIKTKIMITCQESHKTH